MMQHSISSINTHQDQGASKSPVPLTPKSSWSHDLSECPPAPPAHCAGDFFFGMESSSPIYMPMLPSTLSPSSEWEESPILRPRPSYSSIEHTQDSRQIVSLSYPHFSSEGSCCPSPAPLDDESCSLSDESADDPFADFPFTSKLRSQGFSLKDSTIWACPLPSMMNGDSPTSVRLHPRSLPLRSNYEARGDSSLPLTPMEF